MHCLEPRLGLANWYRSGWQFAPGDGRPAMKLAHIYVNHIDQFCVPPEFAEYAREKHLKRQADSDDLTLLDGQVHMLLNILHKTNVLHRIDKDLNEFTGIVIEM